MNIQEAISKFKNREVKAKQVFSIKEISKDMSYAFVKQYHYLGTKDFLGYKCYGLFFESTLIGVATYAPPAGVSSLKGWFSLPNTCKEVLELTRLCLLPELNGTNATSFLLSNSMNMLHRDYGIRAIITLADASRHVGSIYQVCNFKYYGLTQPNKDFYSIDGTKNKWGTNKDMEGVYLERSRKHRYAFIFDENLHCNYKEEPRPTKDCEKLKPTCCNGLYYVYDARNNKYYTCPKCTSKMIEITKDEAESINNDLNKAEELINRKINEGSLWD